MCVQVVLKIIICELKLIPNIDGVLGKSKKLLDTKLYVLKTEIAPLCSIMINESSPEEVLSQRYRLGLLSKLRLSHAILHKNIISYLNCTKIKNCFKVIFIKFDDRFCLVDEHEVSPLDKSRISCSLSLVDHALVSIKLPVDSDGGVVREDIEILAQVFHEVIGSCNSAIALH